MNLVTPDSGLIFWMTLIFAIVFVILAKFGFPVITGMVDKRQEKIEGSLRDAQKAREEVEHLQQLRDQMIAEAHTQQAQILSEAAKQRQTLLERSKAEWEYAARGGNRSQGHIYPGSDISILAAWCYNNAGTYILNENKWDYWELRNNGNSPHYVKQLLPNELGLYDMGGNLYEYCSDWLGDYPEEPQTNPQGPQSGSMRVIRGGCWAIWSNSARVSHRPAQSYNSDYVGLRLAMSTE